MWQRGNSHHGSPGSRSLPSGGWAIKCSGFHPGGSAGRYHRESDIPPTTDVAISNCTSNCRLKKVWHSTITIFLSLARQARNDRLKRTPTASDTYAWNICVSLRNLKSKKPMYVEPRSEDRRGRVEKNVSARVSLGEPCVIVCIWAVDGPRCALGVPATTYLAMGWMFEPVYIMMKKKTPERYRRGTIELSCTDTNTRERPHEPEGSGKQQAKPTAVAQTGFSPTHTHTHKEGAPA